MTEVDSAALVSRIRAEVQADLGSLTPHLRRWIDAHLVEPCLIDVFEHPEGSDMRRVWAVTGDTGVQDSSCRVVYDPEARAFGLEMTLANGRPWYMGVYGTFAEAVQNM